MGFISAKCFIEVLWSYAWCWSGNSSTGLSASRDWLAMSGAGRTVLSSLPFSMTRGVSPVIIYCLLSNTPANTCIWLLQFISCISWLPVAFPALCSHSTAPPLKKFQHDSPLLWLPTPCRRSRRGSCSATRSARACLLSRLDMLMMFLSLQSLSTPSLTSLWWPVMTDCVRGTSSLATCSNTDDSHWWKCWMFDNVHWILQPQLSDCTNCVNASSQLSCPLFKSESVRHGFNNNSINA